MSQPEPPLSPGPEALAVIEAAVAIVLAADEAERAGAAAPRWRFSGRWWSEQRLRRARP